MNIFEPHSEKQNRAIFTEKPILLLGAGTQWGKTRVGALRMKAAIHQFTHKDDAFIITAPTYKTLHQSTLPAFLKIMGGHGVYDKKFDEFRIDNGQKVYCRTATDPDSIVGITNVKKIWGDEAGKYSRYFWENIQARADFCGCGVDLTTSPYSMNWIPKELIKPHQKGLREDIEYVQAASWENPYHSLHNEEKREAKRRTMDPRRFEMLYGGLFGKIHGLVYDCFSEDAHVVKPFQMPQGTKFYAGIDWGFTDPFVLVVQALLPNGQRVQVSEYYKTGLTLSDMITIAKQKKEIFKILKFYADPSQPGSIEEFNRNGLPTEGADNDIRRGVDSLYGYLKTGQFHIFEGSSPHTLDEISAYHYPEPEEIGPDDNSKEQKPVGQNDHALDALRYVTISTRNSIVKHTPKTPEENRDIRNMDQEKRLNFLKKKSRQNHGSESFS